MGKSAKHSHQPTTLYDHIRELQTRFLAVFATLIVASFVVYAFYGQILTILSSPLNAPLYYNSPSGGFAFVMKICLMGALIITMPVLAYNLIMFVRPAFENFLPMKRVFITAGTSTVLAVAGALFAFYCILPESLAFFKGFEVSGLSALISADSYLGFVTNIIITFIIIFQLPLVIAFIDKIKPLQPKRLLKFEKWIVLGSSIVALIVPFTYDFVTSILIAVPIIVLYNLSILIVVLNHANTARKVQAIVIKPAITTIASEPIPLDEQVFGNFAEELARLEKPQPVQPIISKRPVSIAKGVMDVNLKARPQQTVEPAAWVLERKLRREAIMKQMYAFSEVNQNASVKRVGAN